MRAVTLAALFYVLMENPGAERGCRAGVSKKSLTLRRWGFPYTLPLLFLQ